MLNVLSFTEVGGHRENEDAFAALTHPLDSNTVVCVVADGQGGRAGGGPAARLACRSVSEAAVALPPDRLTDRCSWTALLQRADEAVRDNPAAGYTTLVGLCVAPGRVVGASSGDSAALLVAAASGVVLTRGQRKNPPVGSGEAEVVPFEAGLTGPWRLLVMTDGVWKYVGWRRVIEAARQESGAELVARLESAARLPGSGRFPDDFTVVLLEPQTDTQHS